MSDAIPVSMERFAPQSFSERAAGKAISILLRIREA